MIETKRTVLEMTREERLIRIAWHIEEIFACQGYREALTVPGSVADWMGPRLHRIEELAKETK